MADMSYCNMNFFSSQLLLCNFKVLQLLLRHIPFGCSDLILKWEWWCNWEHEEEERAGVNIPFKDRLAGLAAGGWTDVWHGKHYRREEEHEHAHPHTHTHTHSRRRVCLDLQPLNMSDVRKQLRMLQIPRCVRVVLFLTESPCSPVRKETDKSNARRSAKRIWPKPPTNWAWLDLRRVRPCK